MSNFGNFKKYLHCVLAARILIVDFVVCTLAVKKENQGRFRPVGWTKFSGSSLCFKHINIRATDSA
jgi:hypothetical protein